MSAIATESSAVDQRAGEHEEHHPTDTDYVKVAIGLAVLTAIEVALTYIEGIKGMALLIPLFLIMGIKFVIVAGQFMHLKFDSKLLSRVFYSGLVLAIGVYIAALTTFQVFDGKDCTGFAGSTQGVEQCE